MNQPAFTPDISTRGYVPEGMKIRQAPTHEVVFVFLWFIATIWATLPGMGPIRYLLAATFVGSLVVYSKDLVPILQKHWVLFLLAIMAMVSAFWAPNANEAIRKGLLWAMTVIVAIYIAGRLSRRQIIIIYFFIEFAACLMSAANPRVAEGGGFMIGIFDQKNVLATHMMFLMASATALAFNKEVNGWLRLLAVAIMPVAVYLILGSKSATVLVFTIAMMFAFIVHAFIWQPFQKIPHLRTFITLFFTMLVTLIILVVFGLMELDVKEALFDALGKDSTLTGRTMLWDRAKEIMKHNPWGLGANGFWQPNVGAANTITKFFHYKMFVKFSFHNSYLEIGTQLGYLGMAFAYLTAGWCAFNAVWNWVRVQTLDAFFFLVMALLIVQRSFTEVDLDGEFGLTLIMLYIAAMSRHILVPDARAVPAMAPPPTFQQPPPRPSRYPSTAR